VIPFALGDEAAAGAVDVDGWVEFTAVSLDSGLVLKG
jgi:hypothetical protein